MGAIHVAEKGREEEPKVVVVQESQDYPQPVDQKGNPVPDANGQPWSQEVLKIYNTPGNIKTLETIQAELDGNKNTGQQPAEATPQPEKKTYLADWDSGMTIDQAHNKYGHSVNDLWFDKNKWGKDNGKIVEVTEYSDALRGGKVDADKTKEEQEKEEKRRRNSELWGDAGHLLIGLGNFVGAIGGAPEPGAHAYAHAQKLKDSQRLRREKVLEERQAYNRYQLEQMYKQRAEERARELQKAKVEYQNALTEAAKQKAEDNTKLNESKIAYYDAQTGKTTPNTQGGNKNSQYSKPSQTDWSKYKRNKQ
ncbi:MAG: hypothetical protein IJQ13_04490 [Prevotella sp.]|nr:hypothetical protein [Prevotella sp.]